MRRSLCLTSLLVLAALLGGCRATVHHQAPRRQPKPVPAHVHDASCGHYWHRGKWHLVRGHVHRPGCGHVYKGGRWIVVIK